MPPSVRIAGSRAELTVLVCDEIAGAARRAIEASGRCSLLLSGGSTPQPAYRLLATHPLDWSRVHLFLGDERHVPPDHADSNYGMVRRTLLDRVPCPPANVHRYRTEEPDSDRVAARYEAELRRWFDLAPGEIPRFDLALLGLGTDGHTASLFPGSGALDETERLVAPVHLGDGRADRLTVTYPVLTAVARIRFLVAGAAKAAVVAAIVNGTDVGRSYPAGRVDPASGDLAWLLDDDAAGQLARG